ncbi:MAG TPA: hypothetical protein VN083_07265 [Vicinamibacteria bacterium]|jgi:hypothetical protein|nr:hypothetical protein [Vicinamibacteria bacterium]
MGRIVDLCGEIAAVAEEGPEGLFLAPEDLARLRSDWSEEDIEDGLSLVHESLVQGELVDAADSLSARLVDLLGQLGKASAFRSPEEEGPRLSVDVVGQIVRRVARLEEILEVFREGSPPDRRGFDDLQRRLADLGIAEPMETETESEDNESPDDGE